MKYTQRNEKTKTNMKKNQNGQPFPCNFLFLTIKLENKYNKIRGIKNDINYFVLIVVFCFKFNVGLLGIIFNISSEQLWLQVLCIFVWKREWNKVMGQLPDDVPSEFIIEMRLFMFKRLKTKIKTIVKFY